MNYVTAVTDKVLRRIDNDEEAAWVERVEYATETISAAVRNEVHRDIESLFDRVEMDMQMDVESISARLNPGEREQAENQFSLVIAMRDMVLRTIG